MPETVYVYELQMNPQSPALKWPIYGQELHFHDTANPQNYPNNGW